MRKRAGHINGGWLTRRNGDLLGAIDPRRPDRFDIFRYRPASPGTAPAPRTVNLAFGAGRHFCAGHAFSRAQVRIAIEALIQRFPDLALDPARPPEFRGWEFRAPRRLDVLL